MADMREVYDNLTIINLYNLKIRAYAIAVVEKARFLAKNQHTQKKS